ncbi:MAG: hypothetical protein JNM00_12725, partial [Flavobacteriales bacterium]|nr:hypothetical protein [Flavobacteriales bacterium]
MKYFLLGAAFSLQCIANAQFEVPNGNFEVWDLYNTWTLEPLDWETPNDQLIASVRQDSAAYEGELAMRVTVLPGFEGGVPQEASILIPTDVAPDQLQFAVKTNVPEDVEQDRVEVKVEFLSDNELLYDQTWQSFESIIEWEIVTMEFPEIFVDISHVRITVSAGFTSGLFGGSWDTWISVDQMSEMITAVDAYLDQDDFL